MRVCIFVEPQHGATYEDQLRFARHVEACGFEGFLRADHFQAMGDAVGLPGPTDAWTTLAGLARETSRIRLGTLVTSATFRPPGLLAIIAAQVDQMSGGRIDLGIGAGWYEQEHRSYGVPFPPAAERFDRFEEQLAVITGLWATEVGQLFTYQGHHYHLTNSPALPKPQQVPGPPIIIGGLGAKRTPELAARFADEYNMPFRCPADAKLIYERVTEACERVGRGSTGRSPIVLSAGIAIACGRSDAEALRRAVALNEKSAVPPTDPVIGTPAQLVDRIGEFAAIGVSRIHLRVPDIADLDHLDLIAAEVLPRLD
jgi:F420-dependent oxidoreductase-like protein